MKQFLLLIFLLSIIPCFGQNIIKSVPVRAKCVLKDAPKSGSEFIKLKKGEHVDVIDIVDSYYKVKYGEKTGYINEVFIYDQELINIRKKRAEAIKRKEVDEKKQMLTQKYGSLNAHYIMSHEVKIGMTQEVATLSWGSPDDINRTLTENTVYEQWVYRGEDFNNQYLYFEDGILKTIQE